MNKVYQILAGAVFLLSSFAANALLVQTEQEATSFDNYAAPVENKARDNDAAKYKKPDYKNLMKAYEPVNYDIDLDAGQNVNSLVVKGDTLVITGSEPEYAKWNFELGDKMEVLNESHDNGWFLLKLKTTESGVSRAFFELVYSHDGEIKILKSIRLAVTVRP